MNPQNKYSYAMILNEIQSLKKRLDSLPAYCGPYNPEIWNNIYKAQKSNESAPAVALNKNIKLAVVYNDIDNMLSNASRLLCMAESRVSSIGKTKSKSSMLRINSEFSQKASMLG